MTFLLVSQIPLPSQNWARLLEEARDETGPGVDVHRPALHGLPPS